VTKIIYLILINLVTPKARAKHESFVQQTGLSFLLKWVPGQGPEQKESEKTVL